jgi:hypothetical protein
MRMIVTPAMSEGVFEVPLNYDHFAAEEHWSFQEALDPTGKFSENFSPAVHVSKVQVLDNASAKQFCGITLFGATCGVGASGDTVNLDVCPDIDAHGLRPVTPAWAGSGAAPTTGNGLLWKVQFKLGSCSQDEPAEGTNLIIRFSLQ